MTDRIRQASLLECGSPACTSGNFDLLSRFHWPLYHISVRVNIPTYMCHVNILPVFHGSEMGAKTEGVVCDDYYGFLDTFGKIWPCLRSQDIVGDFPLDDGEYQHGYGKDSSGKIEKKWASRFRSPGSPWTCKGSIFSSVGDRNSTVREMALTDSLTVLPPEETSFDGPGSDGFDDSGSDDFGSHKIAFEGIHDSLCQLDRLAMPIRKSSISLNLVQTPVPIDWFSSGPPKRSVRGNLVVR
ncbi:hypothetical protein V8E54_009006 [Elaphomyces granulatus]